MFRRNRTAARKNRDSILRRAVMDALESRRLLTTSLDVNGLLSIDGTPGNDTISLSVANNQVTVMLNGSADGGPFDLASITSIHMTGGDGDDNLSLAGVSISGVIDGGNGNDTLTGGTGNDTLNGNDGDDSFIANDGHADTLDGGAGSDTAVADNALDTFTNIEFGVPLPAAQVTVTTGSTNIADGSTVPIDFGTATQGKTGPTIVFTVQNTGDDTLTLGTPTLPAGFTLVDPLTGPLAPGASDTFSIRVDTTNTGTFSGDVSFANSDPNQNPFNFTITAIVQPANDPAATVQLARPAGPIDNGNSSVEFGNRPLKSVGPTRTFRIYNTGTSDLTIGDITIPTGFLLVAPLTGTIAPGAGGSFTIKLDTSTPGNYDGFVSIPTNDPLRNPFTFRITGVVGIDATPQPEITMQTWQSRQYRGVVSGSSNFTLGTNTVGAAATARTFRIVNDGAANLVLGKLNLPAGFFAIDPLASSLKPGQVDTLVIGMSTATAGSKSGTVSFATNDSNENPYTFRVYGTVLPSTSAGPAVTASLASGTLTVNGTNGIDTITIGSSSRGVSVLANSKNIAGSPFKGVARIVINGYDGDDRIDASTIALPTTIRGGNGNDTIVGGSAADYIDGGAGNDLIDGGAGNDTLLGGAGNDVITGGLGLDSMLGGDGNDTLNAGDGLADTLVDGGPGTDVIHKDRTDNGTGT